MKHRNRRPKRFADDVDREFAQALVGHLPDNLSSGKHVERKTRQFCRQVERALNLALAERSTEDDLNEVFVDAVAPAPHCGHLLVHVIIPASRPVNEALSALRREAPRLRSEVAAAIARKRAPELSFVPAFPGGSDE